MPLLFMYCSEEIYGPDAKTNSGPLLTFLHTQPADESENQRTILIVSRCISLAVGLEMKDEMTPQGCFWMTLSPPVLNHIAIPSPQFFKVVLLSLKKKTKPSRAPPTICRPLPCCLRRCVQNSANIVSEKGSDIHPFDILSGWMI